MKLTCPKCKTTFDVSDVVGELERKAIYRFVSRILEENEEEHTKTKEAV